MTSAKRLFPTTLLSLFIAGSSLAQKQPVKYTDYDRGYNLWYYAKWDSAFLMFNRYVSNADDTLKKGSAYKYIGEIQWNIGDLYGAQESLTNAIQTLDPGNNKHHEELGFVYNVLGNVSKDLKLYDEAIHFYNNAISFVKGSGFVQEVMNGKATALQKKGDYKAAIAIYDSMLTGKPADQAVVTRIIHNRARSKWLQQPNDGVLPAFHAALKIRLDSQYTTGLNTSYAHLSDYYAKSNRDSALWYATKMREQATQNRSPDDVLEAIDKLIRLTSSPGLKQQWYSEYRNLNDSLQFSRDTTKNRFALIRYDVQKSKADNLVLQQHITRQQLAMYGVTALALAIIAGLYAWYASRRKKIKQDAEHAIRTDRLKTSQKVHDVVANGLYGIMNELEHRNNVEQETLIVKIEALYEKSRNISYEHTDSSDKAGYDAEVHHLLNGFANEQTNIIIVGNQPAFWNTLTGHQRKELQLILNELMVNMKKHSQAKNVVVHFHQEHHSATITYKDDGVGFAPAVRFGNGLQNTVSRIKSIKGQVTFEKSEQAGLSIAISFALESSKT